jgi:hypothetical protein
MTDVTDSLLGIFSDAGDAAQAVTALRRAGFGGPDLDVLSGCPYPEGAFGEEPSRHHLYAYPFAGAACGLAVGIFLTVGTQLSFPVVTGGKPILSVPPMINVLYEGTLLGAIIATFLGVLFESRLPDLETTPYDPRITEGYLGVLVRPGGERRDEAERALRDAGAVDVVTSPPPAPPDQTAQPAAESAG